MVLINVSQPSDQIPKPVAIDCLGCGSTRIVLGTRHAETAECPRCQYLGWTYSRDRVPISHGHDD
jgi:uncharacterized paraquat-inducible protein A